MNNLILIVDKDANFAKDFRDVLKAEGFDVVIARDGAHAIGVMKTNVPNLIFLDLITPVMDGWEFLGVLDHDARLSAIPRVIVTDHSPLERQPPPAAGFIEKRSATYENLVRIAKQICKIDGHSID